MDDQKYKQSCLSLEVHSALRDSSSSTLYECHTACTSCHSIRSSVTSCSEVSISSTTLSSRFNLSQIISLTPYSRMWGQGYLNFDWKLSPDMLSVAERVDECLTKKINDWSSKPIDAQEYLNLAELSSIIDIRSAEAAWGLLCPESFTLRSYPFVKEFSQYFLRLSGHSPSIWDLPFQIPISIRCKLDPQYREVWEKIYPDQFNITDEALTKDIINSVDSYAEGLSLMVLLEIMIDTKGLLRASNFLKAIIEQGHILERQISVSEEQLANLLATYVRSLRCKVLQVPIESSDEFKFDMLNFGHHIWNLYTLRGPLSQRPGLFAAVIAKLEGIEIAFALWIFLEALNCHCNDRPAFTRALYERMQDRFLCWHPERDLPWLLPAFCVMNFLLLMTRRNPTCPFFDLLHPVMITCCGRVEWKSVWQTTHQESQLKCLIKHMLKR